MAAETIMATRKAKSVFVVFVLASLVISVQSIPTLTKSKNQRIPRAASRTPPTVISFLPRNRKKNSTSRFWMEGYGEFPGYHAPGIISQHPLSKTQPNPPFTGLLALKTMTKNGKDIVALPQHIVSDSFTSRSFTEDEVEQFIRAQEEREADFRTYQSKLKITEMQNGSSLSAFGFKSKKSDIAHILSTYDNPPYYNTGPLPDESQRPVKHHISTTVRPIKPVNHTENPLSLYDITKTANISFVDLKERLEKNDIGFENFINFIVRGASLNDVLTLLHLENKNVDIRKKIRKHKNKKRKKKNNRKKYKTIVSNNCGVDCVHHHQTNDSLLSRTLPPFNLSSVSLHLDDEIKTSTAVVESFENEIAEVYKELLQKNNTILPSSESTTYLGLNNSYNIPSVGPDAIDKLEKTKLPIHVIIIISAMLIALAGSTALILLAYSIVKCWTKNDDEKKDKTKNQSESTVKTKV